MKILKAIHQGDVLFLKVAELPTFNKNQPLLPNKEKGVIIHHGEALGHYHTAPNFSGLQAFTIAEKDSIKEMALVVTEPTDIVHEEHNTLTLDTGFWIARTQRETVRGLTRAVID